MTSQEGCEEWESICFMQQGSGNKAILTNKYFVQMNCINDIKYGCMTKFMHRISLSQFYLCHSMFSVLRLAKILRENFPFGKFRAALYLAPTSVWACEESLPEVTLLGGQSQTCVTSPLHLPFFFSRTNLRKSEILVPGPTVHLFHST